MSLLFRAFASYYKMKTHSGIKKRIKIIGSLWERHFMFYPTSKHHKLINKSKNNLKRKTNPKELTCPGDVKRLKRLMPYWNFKKYKN
ncbi:unnamed protein product [Blepharisma stoltei]|uniref:50S ribosomal protein L35, chloroplastic n=1 Tax=Blepharisma stoltei TaxID=1481888 RepID=A0AAU9JP77_9CILI|nr:unnamed protein product [Blepharisma stoltei]